MSAEAIRIINAAISRNNGNTITSVDDGTPEAIFASLNYEQMVETALVENPWKFARATDDCSPLAETPVDTCWSNAWQLPDGLLKLRTILNAGQPVDYVISQDGEVWVNAVSDVKAVYTYRAEEARWPADFTEGLTLRLEAAFLRLDERVSEAQDREAAAERRMARARLVHSQEEAPQERKHYPLIAARRTGYATFHRY